MAIPIIGVSSVMGQIREKSAAMAETEPNVIISGETGTGKEQVARYMYQQSARRDKPFVKIACGAIEDNAMMDKWLGLMNQGVLMLDKVEALPDHLKARLLDIFKKTNGANKSGNLLDMWVIATTHQDLNALFGQSDAQDALLGQLAQETISVPPLRKRPEDIFPLMDHFFKELTAYNSDISYRLPNTRQLYLLKRHDWPGNARELQQTVKQFLETGNWDEVIEALGINGRHSPVQLFTETPLYQTL